MMDDDISDTTRNNKKILTNSISYTINKKMNVYDIKLDSILKKLENNCDYTKNIIEVLKLNNNSLEQKISNLEGKIYTLENIILNLKKEEYNNLEITKKYKEINKENIEEINKENIEEINKENIEEIDKKNIEEINKKHIEETKIIKTFSNNENKYKDLKEEYANLDYNFVKSCLDNTNIQSDIKIFKKIYIDNVPKEYYPIRHIKKKFQYWKDDHMNDDDSNGIYIKNIILKNIEQCYLNINIFENYTNDIDQFLKNQDHINKLREEKYKDKFLSKIISIINI